MKVDFYIDLYTDNITANIDLLQGGSGGSGLYMSSRPRHRPSDSGRVKVTVDLPSQYFKQAFDNEGVHTDSEIIKEFTEEKI